MHTEFLSRDASLAILPSGRKVSTKGVRYFDAGEVELVELGGKGAGELPLGTPLASVIYADGGEVVIAGATDIAAFDAALNTVGVYVNAPTLKGEDADGDGGVG